MLDEGETVTQRIGSDYVLNLPLRPPGDTRPIAMFSTMVPVALVDRGVSRDLHGLYLILGIVDFVLMRRYARPDRPPPREELPEPAVTY